MSKMWKKSSLKSVIANMCNDHIQTTELVVVQVLCNMEDERIFSALSFLKSKLHDRLQIHLDLCVLSFSQPLFALQTFPHEHAIEDWKHIKI